MGCPAKSFRILPSLLKSHQVKLSYFQLIDTYLKRNCELNVDELLEFFFSDCSQEKRDFLLWSKIRCTSSLNVELYEEKLALSQATEIDEKVSWLLNEIDSSNKEWRTLSFVSGKKYSFKVQECRDGVVKYTYLSNQNEDTIKFMFLNTMNWNSKVTFSKTDPYAKTLTVHVGGKYPMKLKFAFETRKTLRGTLTIRKPISSYVADFPDTYYQIVRMSREEESTDLPTKIEVWEYY